MSDTDLASRIRQRREQLSLSQEELAARMGYRSKSSITKLEKAAPVQQKESLSLMSYYRIILQDVMPVH